MCVCVDERERERGREGEGDSAREREIKGEAATEKDSARIVQGFSFRD